MSRCLAILFLVFSGLWASDPIKFTDLGWEVRGRYDPPGWGDTWHHSISNQDWINKVKRVSVDTIRLVPFKEQEWDQTRTATHAMDFEWEDGNGLQKKTLRVDFGPLSEFKVGYGVPLDPPRHMGGPVSEADALRYEAGRLLVWCTQLRSIQIFSYTKEVCCPWVYEGRSVLYEERLQSDALDVEFDIRPLAEGRLEYAIRNATRGGNLLLSWDHGRTWESMVPQTLSKWPPWDRDRSAEITKGHQGALRLDPEKLAKQPDPLFLIQGTRGLKARFRFFSYLRGWLPEPFKFYPLPTAPPPAPAPGLAPRIVEVTTVDLPDDAMPPRRYLRVRFNKPVYGFKGSLWGDRKPPSGLAKIPCEGALLFQDNKYDYSEAQRAWSWSWTPGWAPESQSLRFSTEQGSGVDQVFLQLNSYTWGPRKPIGGHYRLGWKGTLVDEDGRPLEGGPFEFDVPRAADEPPPKPKPKVNFGESFSSSDLDFFPTAPPPPPAPGFAPRIMDVITVDLPGGAKPPRRYLRVRFNKPVYGLKHSLSSDRKPPPNLAAIPFDGEPLLQQREGSGVQQTWSPDWGPGWLLSQLSKEQGSGVHQIFLQLNERGPESGSREPISGHFRLRWKGTLVDEDGRPLEGEPFEFDVPRASDEPPPKPKPKVLFGEQGVILRDDLPKK